MLLERREHRRIVAPRQTGKSSLMTHARAALKSGAVEREADDRSAFVDLQGSGSETDPERWVRRDRLQGRTKKKKKKTGLVEGPHPSSGPPTASWGSLADVVLGEVKGDVVVFVDEIETVFGLPFSDDFFLTIPVPRERSQD